MSRVALVTASRLPDGMEDTSGLISHLARIGLKPELVVWSDQEISWDKFDCIFLHSPWDYSARLPEFLAWLATFEADARLLNSYSLISWNLDKRYLRDLAELGVLLPSTLIGTLGAEIDQAALEKLAAGSPLVVKPVMAAGGRRTYLRDNAAHTLDLVRQEFPREAIIVQQYEPAIRSTGEYSAVLFTGELSHVVRKCVQGDEFRVQSHFGGTAERIPAERWMAEYAARIVHHLPEPPAYARVDFIVDAAGDAKLMEVELAEPDLFLRYREGAYGLLAELIAGVV